MAKSALLVSLLALFLGVAVSAALSDDDPPGVHALFDLTTLSGGPFPTDRFTVPDASQNTDLRVALPVPEPAECAARPSDCDDVGTLNTLDGFNLQPRLSIPFSGPIDVNTVTSETVFLLGPDGQIEINQVVWDPETNALHVESDELLEQHTRYVLIVMRGVRDAAGEFLDASGRFQAFRHSRRQYDDPAITRYRVALLEGLADAEAAGIDLNRIAVASVFTTQSVTAILEEIRDQIKSATPAPADFLLGSPGGTRTVFPVSSMTAITYHGLLRTNPPVFSNSNNTGGLNFLKQTYPGAVGRIAFGKYTSPDYLTPCVPPEPGEPPCDQSIPPVGTRTGTPQVQGTNDIFFNLYLPSGTPPQGGWPVVIYGGGSPGDQKTFTLRVASSMATRGLALIAINAVGLGLGPGTMTVTAGGQTVMLPSGGRSFDQNGNTLIGSGVAPTGEGFEALTLGGFIRPRDAPRQTAVDLIQLARVIEVGMDVDGDGTRELDPARIYYWSWSYGSTYGTMLTAIEPLVRAAVVTAAGGGNVDAFRLSVGNRPAVGSYLERRMPSLVNPPGLTSLGGVALLGPHFNENLPPANAPPVINDVTGAMEIQRALDEAQWVGQASDPTTYAVYLNKEPLEGVPAKPVIVHFARGDQTVTNPATTLFIRTGELGGSATLFRNDLAFAQNPIFTRNPHDWVARLSPPQTGDPLAVALAAQRQAAEFFASDGTTVADPDDFLAGGCGCWFDVPIGQLPEDLGFIPPP